MSTPVKLRLHHFICLQGFNGKGYSPGFVKNCKRVLNELEKPGAQVEAVVGVDDICGPCPRNERHTHCQDEHKTAFIDDAYENCLNIHPGQKMSWDEAKLIVADRVSEEDFEANCRHCTWQIQGNCRQALKRLRETHQLQAVGPV